MASATSDDDAVANAALALNDDAWASEDATSDDDDPWDLDSSKFRDEDGNLTSDEEKWEVRKRARADENAASLYRTATTPRSDAIIDIDLQYCPVRVQDEDRRRAIVQHLPREWIFLVDFFYDMRKTMALDDEKRVDPLDRYTIGRSEQDDWRIRFEVSGHQHANNLHAREAIILQTMMLQVDYTAWVRALIEIMRFQAPRFVHLDYTKSGMDALPRRFTYTFNSDLHARDYEWHRFVKELFQPPRKPYDMMWTYCSAYQVVSSKGFDMAQMKPIPVKLEFAPQHCGYLRQVTILTSIMQILSKTTMIEERRRKRRRWRACPQLQAPPVLFVDCIELDLREFTAHPAVLNALEKLVATGVRIRNLVLPGRAFDGVYDEHQFRATLASLLCSVMGIEGCRQGSHLAVVDRLVVPPFYMKPDYSLPLFMAARDARGIKAIRLEVGAMLKYRYAVQDRRFGALVGYAFFSKHSQSSITTVDIDPAVFTDGMMSAIERAVDAEDSMDELRHAIIGDEGTKCISTRGLPISVKKGTALFPPWGGLAIKTHALWTGTVVHDDEKKTTLTVYVPGFGLCDIERSQLPIKKRRTISSVESSAPVSIGTAAEISYLRHFSLHLRSDADSHDEDAVLDPTILAARIGAIVGRHLETFRLSSTLTNDDTVREILDHYTNLHSLSLLNARLDDLSGFAIGYHESCHISSLNLSGCQIPIVVFKSLMRWLSTDKKVMRSLHRLRFGKGWDNSFFTETTINMIISMLNANKQLTHLHIHIRGKPSEWSAVSAFQGEQLPGSSLPRRRQLALLSILRQTRPSQTSTFDSYLVEHILGFVAPSKRRTVIIEPPPRPTIERDPYRRMVQELHENADY